MRSRTLSFLAAVLAAAAVIACRPDQGARPPAGARDSAAQKAPADSERDTGPRDQPIAAADTATIARGTDTTITNARPGTLRIESLDALADSISDRMTFLALTQTSFIAATRGKRLLLDLGRYDGTIAGGRQKRAFDTAAKVLSPVKVGDRLALRGVFGADTATVTGYALWNGRIVATLAVAPRVDSLAKSGATIVALATRPPPPLFPDTTPPKPDTTPPAPAPPPPAPPPPAPTPPPSTVAPGAVPLPANAAPDSAALADSIAKAQGCRRDSVDEALVLRVAELADSVALVLEADTAKLTDRLKKSIKTQRSQAVGCFGKWRVMLFVNQSAGDYEYVHQIALLVDTAGVATPLTVRDLRFKAHEAIEAFDEDGDGIDDIAVRGRGNRIGGTVILHFDPNRKRLEYVMGGFAWEEM